MALETLIPGTETGSTSRDKINAAITELNKILDFPTAEGEYVLKVDASGNITWITTAASDTVPATGD